MSRRRRTQKKSSSSDGIAETFFGFIFWAIAYFVSTWMLWKDEQKRTNKIDPYKVTGAAMGMGLVNDTQSLLQLGGVLGAMGAFDDDDTNVVATHNRYAWRLNCQDGSAYGVNPCSYETREAYHEALAIQKSRMTVATSPTTDTPITATKIETHLYCIVTLEETKETLYYRTENKLLKVGDRVVVPNVSAGGVSVGVIQSIEEYTSTTVPVAVKDTPLIYGTV